MQQILAALEPACSVALCTLLERATMHYFMQDIHALLHVMSLVNWLKHGK